MKVLSKIIFAISALISLLVLMLFGLFLVAWLGGGESVLLPGLGLIVGMGAIVILLLIILSISIAITFLLYKMAFKNFSQ